MYDHSNLNGNVGFIWSAALVICRLISFVLMFAGITLSTGYAQEGGIDPVAAQADPDFNLQGEYQSQTDAASQRGVQVVALGDGKFRVVVFKGGLPGASWDGQPPQVLAEEETSAVTDLLTSLEVSKVVRSSPTLNAAPPEGAIVLFDGTKETFEKEWKPGARMTAEGLLEQGATSVQTFQDFSAHIEFMTPFLPKARGQGRGNSGIYYQGRYETQVLDSFGLEGKENETGAIYSVRAPDANYCFPPLTWQTYDVEFTAARFDAAGTKTSNAVLTVRLNGHLVQRDIEIPHVTRAAPVPESAEPGPLFLQDHSNSVRFRNIWIVPRDADREARRPRIPGFERFHAMSNEATAGGSLLVGELGCVNCHIASADLKQRFDSKIAPRLSEVGARVQPAWMMKFIADPHGVKPGSTMPQMFVGWSESKRDEAVLALTNFLAATGRPANQSLNLQASKRGKKLFYEVGCVVCHGPQDGESVPAATSVLLADLSAKYTVTSLAEFLKNPHAVRPSGRMPSLNLKDKEPEDLAHYLAAGSAAQLPPNLHYAAYHGSWQELPDFSQLQPVKTGTCAGLDLSVAERDNQFGVVYDGYFLAEREGEYRFWIGSDDGSALIIDDQRVMDVDGIHPHSIKEGRVTLTPGVHSVRIVYFEQAGEESLTLDLQAPGGTRVEASSLFTLNEDGTPVESEKQDQSVAGGMEFRRDTSLVEKGKELFISLGCANCHEMKFGDERLTGKEAVEFTNLRADHGCLSEERTADTQDAVPDFELSPGQKAAVVAVIGTDAPTVVQSQSSISETMIRFNCYACHERDGKGGPEAERNSFFLTTQHEMGDEGRIPPSLNGVGDKLNDRYLNAVLQHGANERPYMLTRMPKFDVESVRNLSQQFIEHDRRSEAALAEFDEPLHRIQATGRALVGDQALACIKCHTFGNHQATGIQALSLTRMTERIREDWFLRYLFDPARFRPGTRMPTGFPNGQAAIRTIYEGDPGKQISAVWTYLKEGERAGVPDGLIAQMIELKPVDEPILYRNFLEGVGPRGIAVGYPEKAHLAWDANELCLKLIWHNRFIDASKHWVGRGPGNQVPLGDHILSLDEAIPFADLESRDQTWPKESVRQREGFQFLGYKLNSAGQPTFLFETPFATVSDFAKPVAGGEGDAHFERSLTVKEKAGGATVYFRAAVGKEIVPLGKGYRVDDSMTIEVTGGGDPFLRENDGHQELLVPVLFESGVCQIRQRIEW